MSKAIRNHINLKTAAITVILVTLIAVLQPAQTYAGNYDCIAIDVLDVHDDDITFEYNCFFTQSRGWWDIFPPTYRVFQTDTLGDINSTGLWRARAKHGDVQNKNRWTTDGCSGPEFNMADIDRSMFEGTIIDVVIHPDNLLGLAMISATGGFVIPDDYFHTACVEHDYCYATPGVSRSECDSAFFDNMKQLCVIGKMGLTCEMNAAIFNQAVLNHGQEAYDNAQNWADTFDPNPYD